MKNFKKVISVVMALAMIISSFTAVSASKFADVADTAAYAEAVEVLEALGVVNGVEQENGTFNFEPEKSVTRAEAATMIVGALNMAADATASAGTSQFADVNSQAAWAAGFVNVGVAQGFIAGYDAASFGPLDNVTYAQMCVMLTKITGYGEYAQAYGGWPTGYTTMAATAGINKGVAVANDTALTKGQVAMMIWNALQAPMLGVKTYTVAGNEYAPLDGKNGEFKTLFSEKFDGYVGTFTVDGTAASGASVEPYEALMTLVRADWCPVEASKIDKTVTCGCNNKVTLAEGVDVSAALLQEVKAVFLYDEDEDERTIVYAKAGSKAVTKEFDAATYYLQKDLHADRQYATTNKIRFGSSYYKFEDAIDVYVNGKLQAAQIKKADATVANDLDWILGNAKGDIKVLKSDADKEYDTIFVNFYQIAEVVSVDVKDDETVIALKGGKSLIGNEAQEIKISTEEVEEGKVVVNVTRNGEVADLKSLVRGDIIAYATDFAEIGTDNKLADPAVLTIIATNDKVTGSVTSIDDNNTVTTNDDIFTVGGSQYGLVPVKAGNANTTNLALKAVVTAELDPFGRIYATEQDASSDTYGIALRVNVADDDSLKVLLADGTTKTYDVDWTDVVGESSSVTAATKTDFINAVNNSTKGVADRMIAYEVSGRTGEIVNIELLSADAAYSTFAQDAYVAKSGIIYGSKLLDTTPVIYVSEADVEDYRDASEYSVMTKADFVDDVKYSGNLYMATTKTLGFLVITTVGTSIGKDSRFAVAVSEPAQILTEEGDREWSVDVLYEGKKQTLIVTGAAKAEITNVKDGCAFFFETNSDGYVKDIIKVEDLQSETTKYEALDWSFDIWNGRTPVQLSYGAVIESDDETIAFASAAQIATGTLDTTAKLTSANQDGLVYYAVADDCEVYTLDTTVKSTKLEELFNVDYPSSIKASNFSIFEVDGAEGKYDSTGKAESLDDRATYAWALIVDSQVVEIFAIEK